MRSGVGTNARDLSASLRAAIAEVGHELLPERRLRAAARVVKRKMSNYGVKRAEHASWPRPTLRPTQAVRVIGAPTEHRGDLPEATDMGPVSPSAA